MKECLNCKTLTSNPKYCTRSCTAIVNNKSIIKRQLTNHCKTCASLIRTNRTYCNNCFSTKRTEYLQIELQQLKAEVGSRNSYLTTIREHARKIIKSIPKICKLCGYDFYVECCHIKPVSSFSKNATLAEVNAITNLVWLCPNHHKELDKGKITTLSLT